ncbi:alanine--tRNA ligase, partial [Epulopiscium sp. SCG-B10WGA-EpuloA2]
YGCGSPECKIGCDCDRYLEFWNLVFTQFNKNEDGSYTPLKFPNIDTGMGLERLAALMQGVHTLFDVDTIKAIRDKVCELSGVEYYEKEKDDISIRVITDHIRSVVFLAADGVRSSNEGRGYVMRRLIRRAIRHGKMLGIKGLFLEPLIDVVVETSKSEYNELEEKYDYIVKSLVVEEQNFNQTIEQGLNILEGYIEKLLQKNQKILDGKSCFKLYDTYGFPLELTLEILSEKGLSADEKEFDEEMQKQRKRARDAHGETNYMGADQTIFDKLDTDITTEFNGYVSYEIETEIEFITSERAILDIANEGEHVFLITKKTPFYAESGGQAGDKGIIITSTGEAQVHNTVKISGGRVVHYVTITTGYIEPKQMANMKVDKLVRLSTGRNHSATHLLQEALKEVLGTHIEQAGSSVNQDRLRFDYTHFEPLTKEQIDQVENRVNQKILEGLEIEVSEMPIDEAKSIGATALFGEKYSDIVRVVNIGGYSIELCGGTHMSNTAQIGLFKLLSETGISSGVRRIEGLTGMAAINYYKDMENRLEEITTLVKSNKSEVFKKVKNLIETIKKLESENQSLKAQINNASIDNIISTAKDINGTKILVTQMDNKEINELKEIGDTFKDKLNLCIIVIASICNGKVNLVVTATNNLLDKGINCSNIIKEVAKVFDGKGGGRPNIAQATGKDITKVQKALDIASEVIEKYLR